MKFRTKRELLEFLGKNPNDNKLVDRMLIRWEVIKIDRMYVYDTKEMVLSEKVKELEKEIKNLNSKIVDLENELENIQSSEDNSELLHKIYVYIKQVLHINIRYDDLLEFVENCPSD